MTDEQLNKLPKYAQDEIRSLRAERDRLAKLLGEHNAKVENPRVLQLNSDPRYPPIVRDDAIYRFWLPSTPQYPKAAEHVDVRCTPVGVSLMGSGPLLVKLRVSNHIVIAATEVDS